MGMPMNYIPEKVPGMSAKNSKPPVKVKIPAYFQFMPVIVYRLDVLKLPEIPLGAS